MRKTELSGAISVREATLSHWTEPEASRHLRKAYRIHFSNARTKARDRAENPFAGDISELALCVLELLCKHSRPKSHALQIATRIGMPRWVDTKAHVVGVRILAEEPDTSPDAMLVDGLEIARKLHKILPWWAFGILTKEGCAHSFGPILVPGESVRRPVPIASERFTDLQIARAVAKLRVTQLDSASKSEPSAKTNRSTPAPQRSLDKASDVLKKHARTDVLSRTEMIRCVGKIRNDNSRRTNRLDRLLSAIERDPRSEWRGVVRVQVPVKTKRSLGYFESLHSLRTLQMLLTSEGWRGTVLMVLLDGSCTR